MIFKEGDLFLYDNFTGSPFIGTVRTTHFGNVHTAIISSYPNFSYTPSGRLPPGSVIYLDAFENAKIYAISNFKTKIAALL